jgi:hypothetical protein
VGGQEIMKAVVAYEIHSYRWYCPHCNTLNDASLSDVEDGKKIKSCYSCEEKVTLKKFKE